MKIENHKIARLVLTESLYDKNGELNVDQIEHGFESFLAKTYGKMHFEFLVMAGGALNTTFPDELTENQYPKALAPELL